MLIDLNILYAGSIPVSNSFAVYGEALFVNILCGRPIRPHYGSYPSVRPSVRLSVCPVRAPNTKAKRDKTKIGVNVFQGRSNWKAI